MKLIPRGFNCSIALCRRGSTRSQPSLVLFSIQMLFETEFIRTGNVANLAMELTILRLLLFLSMRCTIQVLLIAEFILKCNVATFTMKFG